MMIINLLALAAAIEKTALLTAPERAYWSARLSFMTHDQLERFDRLLKDAEKISWTKQALDLVSSMSKSTALTHA